MSFTKRLLDWFKENGRELPWRGTRDPYAIWLSEVILQQTRIQQGRDYWERFMRRWPTVEALAAATEDEVLREWQGLGYYSRARNLLMAARQIVAEGQFPQTMEGLKKLKGVGDYTAAAIGSIAFGLPVAVVDGNVYRVLSRYYGIETPINSTEGKKVFAELAQSLLPQQSSDSHSEAGDTHTETTAGTFNQAMMDFGAIQCTPQSPRCLLCPFVEECAALRQGRVGELPVKLKTTKVTTRHIIYIYVRWQGMTVLRRRQAGDIWQGLWEPLTPSGLVEGDEAAVRQALAPLGGGDGRLRLLQKGVRHVLTHRVLLADFYLWEPTVQPSLADDYVWMKEEEVDDCGVPRLVERLLQAVNEG